MKLWVDAKRGPEVDWVWVKMPVSAIAMLRGGNVESVSFAPDQSKLVGEVVDWMVENGSTATRTIHRSTAGVKYPRGLLQANATTKVRVW